jgi:hypothetical protein
LFWLRAALAFDIEAFQRGLPSFELRASCLRCAESGLGPIRDGLAFMFSYGSEDVNGKFVRTGHIDCLKLDATLNQVRNERNVTGQSV